MSADCVLSGDGTAAHDAETCRAPSCWRDGGPVRVDGREAVLCETHRKALLGVSS